MQLAKFKRWFENLIQLEQKDNNRIVVAKGYMYGESQRDIRPLYLDFSHLQNAHLICTGGSGSGKTALLYHLLTQWIKGGEVVVVLFDPHGDLFLNVLNFLGEMAFSSNDRFQAVADRLVLIEPTQGRNYGFPAINVLEAEAGQDPYELIDEQISCYKVIWQDSWGERMGSILRNCFLLLHEAGLTLREMPYLLMNQEFREFLASKTRNEKLTEYFRYFHSFQDKEQHFFVESARSRSEAFVYHPLVEPILGQANSTIRFTDLINEPGRIILINASRNHLKTETRRLFCSLLFSKLHAAILAREDIPEQERIPVIISVDEAHEVYYPEAFLALLEGGRKFRSQLCMFHQSLDQFPEDDINIILANTGIQCVFHVNRKDAEKYSKEMWSFTGTQIKYEEQDFWGPKGRPTYYSVQEELERAVAELMSQKRRELYIRLKDGKSDKPYISRTLTVNYPSAHEEWVNALRQAVAEKYNRPISNIQEEFRERRRKLEKALEADALEPSPTAKTSKKVRIPKKRQGGEDKNEWV